MPNRLAESTSPYLRQHADNPVDWYPWSPEALERARKEDKPIFLSIGYSACHWCHVMAHESFENPEIAEILNQNFINIKVDREERPDLDHIYMNAMMAMRGGGGGWPLSVFLTPDGKPFFGGTYWPPRSRMNMPGFDQVLHSVLDAWHKRRDQIEQQSQQVVQWLNESNAVGASGEADLQQWLNQLIDWLDRNFDSQHGGFGGAPKFPHAMDLHLLIRCADSPPPNCRVSGEQMLEMVRVTLKRMAYGGIHDHLGGGFARYSVDEFWLVPHFEKMLYDNALLARVYLEMHRKTRDPFFSMVARKTLDYMMRDLGHSEGGFYSAEDADSEGEEGKFYVWKRDEILQILGDEIGTLFCELYNVTPHGNFEGSNILHMTRSYQEFADAKGIEKQELRDLMRQAREKLLEARSRRVRPARDEKILVSWNAVAISALASTAWTIDADQAAPFVERAEQTARFILTQLRDESGRLWHAWSQGKAYQDAFLDDYSFLIVALLDLYRATQRNEWLASAAELTESMLARFADPNGGFFMTADDHEVLVARPKVLQDSSLPSGNAMAAEGLLRLGHILGRSDWIDLASRAIRIASPLIERSPAAFAQSLLVAEQLTRDSQTWMVAVDRQTDGNAILGQLIRQLEPYQHLVTIDHSLKDRVSTSSADNESTTDAAEHRRGFIDWWTQMTTTRPAIDDQPTLYVCRTGTCEPLVTGIDQIIDRVESN